MAASGDKRSRRLPTARAAEIPGIVTPPATDVATPLPGLPGAAVPARTTARKASPKPRATPATTVAPPVEMAVAPVAAVEQAIDRTAEAAETATATVAETTAQVVDRVEEVATAAAGPVAEFTTAVADRAEDAVDASIAAADAVVDIQNAAPAAIAQQETKIMDTIQTTTEKTQAFFTDANERTKGAMEKGTKFFQEMTEFGKGNVEAMVESSKIAARGLETMGQDTAAYMKSSFEDATQALRTLSSIKSPAELMKFQADYVRSAFDALVAQTSRGTEASLKLAGEVAQPIQNRVAVAAEKIKVSA